MGPGLDASRPSALSSDVLGPVEPGLARLGRRVVRALAVLAVVLAAGLLAAACGGPAPAVPAPTAGIPASPAPGGASIPGVPPTGPASQQAAPRPLAGQVIGIDPGHNGRSGTDPTFLGHQVWNGREEEACDTTGTETDAGYPEARFTFNVAGYLRRDLEAEGARVVLTRHGNDGVGPCVNRRSQILNDAHVRAAVDIHADGGPAAGRGFTVLEPVADGPNDKVIAASRRLGADIRTAFLAQTPMRTSDYYGRDGLINRDDLAGLNLTRVPKILIECGNMRNAADARLLTSPQVQREIARALLTAIVRFAA
jgi:N-acetylmuramoyl-L-alanine amidase